MAGRFRSPTPDRIAWTPGQTKAVLRTKHPSLSILAFNVDNMDAIQKRDRSLPLTLGRPVDVIKRVHEKSPRP